METTPTEKTRTIREKDSKADTTNIVMETDRIKPTQLVYSSYDESGYGGTEVLGTFTSKKALGIFLAEKIIDHHYSDSYSALGDLYLKQIQVNPKFTSGVQPT